MPIRELSSGDIDQLLKVHQEAFSGSMGVSLGPKYLTDFLTWFIRQEDSITLAYEEDGNIVGYVFGTPQGYNSKLNRELFMTIMVSVISHPHIILRKGFFNQIPERLQALFSRKFGKTQPVENKDSGSLAYRLVGIGIGSRFQRQGHREAIDVCLCSGSTSKGRSGDSLIGV